MKTINDTLSLIKNNHSIGLMGHIIAHYPDEETSYKAGLGIIKGGADFLEVQFPFSDPTADGPTIEAACYKAIANGFSVEKGFELAARLAHETNAHILIMTYANIIFNYGMEKFIKKASELSIAGLIVPDLPAENDEGLNDLCRTYNLSNILVAAPGADSDRIHLLSETGSGFLYTVGRRGITGKKTDISGETMEWIKLVSSNSILPVALGFGIQTPEQIAALKGHVALAVAGSYFVREIEYAIKENLPIENHLKEKSQFLLSLIK